MQSAGGHIYNFHNANIRCWPIFCCCNFFKTEKCVETMIRQDICDCKRWEWWVWNLVFGQNFKVMRKPEYSRNSILVMTHLLVSFPVRPRLTGHKNCPTKNILNKRLQAEEAHFWLVLSMCHGWGPNFCEAIKQNISYPEWGQSLFLNMKI